MTDRLHRYLDKKIPQKCTYNRQYFATCNQKETNIVHRRIRIFGLGLVFVVGMLGKDSQAVTLTVDARANIFGAGHATPPAPGGGGGGSSLRSFPLLRVLTRFLRSRR